MNSPTRIQTLSTTDQEAQDNKVILPQTFVPASHTTAPVKRRHKPIFYLLAALLFIASIALWFVFSAKSVVISTVPSSNNISVAGNPMLELADHLLMLPGQYQVNATLPGHYPLNKTFDVSELQNQRLTFKFVRLPGHLSLEISPAVNATVYIDQIKADLQGQTINNISAGEHQIMVSAPRYFDHQAKIVIQGKEQTQSLAIELIPAWGNTEISSQPSGAKVFNNGQYLGTTPFNAELLQGEHRLTFTKDGYQQRQRLVESTAGQSTTLPLVTLFKHNGQLVINTVPQGVQVTLGDKYLGVTPLDIAVTPGDKQSLLLFKDGYQQQFHQLNIVSGARSVSRYSLKPLRGEVAFKVTPRDATLYIAGKAKGNANQTARLTATQQQITIKRPGYVDYVANILPNIAMTQVVEVNLKTIEQSRWENMKPLITAASGATLKLFKPNTNFTMGASRREQGRRANETARQIKLTRAFYLGIKEVTNREFQMFQSAHSSGHVKGNSLNGANQPAVKLSWLEAAKFCNWLSQQEGLAPVYEIKDDKVRASNDNANGYRLPTEAEWAWAARYSKGTMLRYTWGDSLPPRNNAGNFADISGAAILGSIQTTYNDKFIATSPVGSFGKNQHGLYDIDGNVAEWIHDYYHIKTGLSNTAELNPTGPKQGNYRVIRGASWALGSRTQLRLSYRDYGLEPRNDVGFRLARNAQ